MYSFKINSESQTVVQFAQGRGWSGYEFESPNAETSTSVDNLLQCLITFTNLKNKTKPLVEKKFFWRLLDFEYRVIRYIEFIPLTFLFYHLVPSRRSVIPSLYMMHPKLSVFG